MAHTPRVVEAPPDWRQWRGPGDTAACVYCGLEQGLTVDHVWPTSRVPPPGRNKVPACGQCNSEKKDLSCQEWTEVMQAELVELADRPSWLWLSTGNHRHRQVRCSERVDLLRARLRNMADLRNVEPFRDRWAVDSRWEDEMIVRDEWANGGRL